MRSRFLLKVYASFAFLIITTAAIVGFSVAKRIQTESLRDLDDSLRSQAALLRDIAAEAFVDGSSSKAQGDFQRLGADLGPRFTAIRSDGVVAADSEKNPENMNNHAGRPEVVQAAEKGIGTTSRHSETLGLRMRYLALPVTEDGQIVGYVRAALSLQSIEERLDRLKSIVLLGAVLAALVGLALGWAFAQRITEPIRSMTLVAESLADGHLDRRVDVESEDEIGKLGQALNRMGREIRGRIEKTTEERNQLQTVLSSMEEGVIAVDSEERITHMNSAAGRILKISPEECVRRPLWEAVRVTQLIEIMRGALKESKESQGEICIPKDSRDLQMVVRGRPLMDSKGGNAGVVLVFHDVSDLRRLEEVRKDFVANVSHEIKTPLTTIVGAVETVIDDPDMTEESRTRFLEKARAQSARLSAIVTDLLALSRVESGQDKLEREPWDLRGPVNESIEAFGALAGQGGLRLEVATSSDPVTVMGVWETFREIIDNLLDNALKYTPEGGRVSVRLSQQDGQAVLEVQDSGIGIDARSQRRIFERFYRVDKARSRELGGTGLGLSIVKNTVSALGGEVSVESALGQGSTFKVLLPLAADEPALDG